MSREARDAEEEAHDEVRAGSSLDAEAHTAHEGGHPERAENDADGAAERPDAEAGEHRRRQAQPLSGPRAHRP